MINIENINPNNSAFASIISVGAGTVSNYVSIFTINFIPLDTVNTMFQHAAWFVAIAAGLVSIKNGTKDWKIRKKITRKIKRK